VWELEEKVYVKEEIDLRDLFKTVWDRRIFILVFTFLVTLLAIVYVNIKMPIYEAKSVVRVGYINLTLIESINILETKLKLIFGVNNQPIITEKEGIVSNISVIKKVDNFLEITTQAYSNEQALSKNKEVVEFLQNEYKYKIDEYTLKINIDIKNLEEQIKYVENVTKIDKEEQINFLNNVDLVTIENKEKFNKEKLNQYQENINQISKRRSTNDTQNMLSAMEMLNYQNLILNLQNQIENLNKEKQNIITEKIPSLKRNLEFDIKTKLDNLKDSIELEKLKLSNNLVKNSEIVGDVLIDDNPIKPKKALIVIVAFVTGFILSIFLVFFMQLIRGFKLK
jgi:uncharacterized protein involved in exopolysaccharide biosynthesis